MSKYIALLANDLHCTLDTIPDFQANWREMLQEAKNCGVEKIVLGGDLFTTRAAQNLYVLLAVKDMIQTVSKSFPLYILNGNHDKIDQSSILSYNHLFDVISNVHIIDTFSVITFKSSDIAIIGISYFPESGKFNEYLDEAIEETADIPTEDKILYIHEGIHGALGDFDIPGELPNNIFGDFDKVLVGHYHNRTDIKDTNISYIGSSRQANFGEDEEKGYTLIDKNGGVGFVKNEVNDRYMTFDVTFKQINDNFLLEITHFRNEGYKVRVKIKCSDTEATQIDRKSLIDAGASKIEVKSDRLEKINGLAAASSAVSEKHDKNSIMKEYVTFCDQKRIESQLGLKYLEKLN